MKLIAVIAAFIVMLPFHGGAEEGKKVTFTGFFKVAKSHSDYRVNPDGTHTETHDMQIEVLTEEGIKSANYVDIRYSEGLQELSILHAYTLKKDGRRIDVPPANFQDRAAIEGGGPMFSDIKTKHIIFPDVAAGDRVGYSYRLVQKTALFPGHFTMSQSFSRHVVNDDARVSVTVPIDSLKLQVFAFGVQGGRSPDKDGRMQWVWSFANREVEAPDPMSVSPIDYGPRIFVSSFRDYGALAAAYEERARPKAAVTDRVRSLADEITRGVTDRREQARLLYGWVSKNINYAGNCIGVGSVVPHDVEAILVNRLGDCKDHTALLQALLAARGIESTPVLINSGTSYKLPEVPTIATLDHVLTYIPGLDLYADSTAQYTPFGMLPAALSGKPAVHTANFSGIRKTPPTDYKANRSNTKMTLQVHEDGSADGETINVETGNMASAIKTLMAQIPPSMEDNVIRAILAGSGFVGTGTLSRGDTHALSDTFSYGLKYHLTNAMNLPGPAAIHIIPIMPGALPTGSSAQQLNMPESKHNYPCHGHITTEEYVIKLPKSVKVISLPRDVRNSNGIAGYEASYRLDGTTITVTRKFESREPDNLCTPEDDRNFRVIAMEVLKDWKSQVIYQPAGE